HRLPHTEGFVATAPYPSVEDYPSDPAVLDEVAAVQEAITEVRRIRADMELAPRQELELRVGDDALLEQLQAHAGARWDLARVRLARLGERPVGVATAVVRGVELVIPLEGIVDFAAEVARLDKVLAK